ncbi:unnamed protein product [Pseudo-nitzschia multistriata]|uniref:Uncharacterized protein n=1 Tax=Pseudo-nitzschia multistriata TaxID=183589 RepID=A0A448ZFA2_9STRA|nr:unnamed protein product [Pseudo-nitzschia multistriata]
MSSKHRLTRSFRTLSALLYVLNISVSFNFLMRGVYLDILVGALMVILCVLMLCVAIEAPSALTTRLENSKMGDILFTFRGRYIVDLLISLFLFAMGVWGIVMGLLTLFLIFGIRFLGVKQPDAFNEIFRQSDVESQSMADSYTLEGTYDTEGTER